MKVLVVSPILNDACSWYRYVGPFSHLNKELDITYKGGHNSFHGWADFAGFDAVVWGRPTDQTTLTHLICAKNMGLKVVVDYDDLLWKVPPSNPHAGQFKNAHKYIPAIAAVADQVWCSTPALSADISTMGPDISVRTIPNAWDFKRFPISNGTDNDSKLIVWRGGASHCMDTLNAIKDLEQFLTVMPDYRFMAIGEMHSTSFIPLREKFGKRIGFLPAMPLEDYLVSLERMKPEYMWVPLEKNEFNECKSNIAWQEATWAGAAIITEQDWDYTLPPAAPTYFPAVRVGNLVQARKFMQSAMSLESANQKRLEMLRSL